MKACVGKIFLKLTTIICVGSIEGIRSYENWTDPRSYGGEKKWLVSNIRKRYLWDFVGASGELW